MLTQINSQLLVKGQALKRWLGKPFNADPRRGMSLIEIIIVVALLGTLMTILVTNLTQKADTARVDQTKIAMGNLSQALQLYKVHNNKYPTTAEGLEALVKNPGSSKNWRGPYIDGEKQLKDAWSNEFQYESNGFVFKIISSGIDQQFGTEDDITFPETAKEEG